MFHVVSTAWTEHVGSGGPDPAQAWWGCLSMQISYHVQSIPLVLTGNGLEGFGVLGGLDDPPPYTVMIQLLKLNASARIKVQTRPYTSDNSMDFI